MIRYITILTALLIVLITPGVKAQKVQVEQKVAVAQMYIGDQTEYTLSVTAPKGSRVAFPAYDFNSDNAVMLSEKSQGLEVVEQTAGDTVTLDDGYVKMTRKYAITAFDANIYTIDSIPVTVNDKIYYGNRLALKVLDVELDTAAIDNDSTSVKTMCPPKKIENNPFAWSDWTPVIAGVILLALIFGAIYWLIVLKKKGKPIHIRFRTIKHIPPHEKAMAEIDTIKKTHLTISEDQKEYYTRLTDALRKYMEERFGFSAMEMTTSEIIDRLRQEDQQKVEELKELFETADLVKFARHETMINENDRNLVAAVDFINSTKTEETTVVKKEQEVLSEQDIKMRRTNITITVLMAVSGITGAIVIGLLVWRVLDLLQ